VGLATSPEGQEFLSVVSTAFNLDGFVDVFIPVYGSPRNTAGAQPNLMLVNQGDGTFRVGTSHGANVPTPSEFRGVGAGGFLLGRNGLLNLVVSYDGPQGGPWRFYENVTPTGSNHFLALMVTSFQGRSAVGARVQVWVGSRMMTSRVGYCSHYSQSVPSWVHFGLGHAVAANKVVISYVGGGTKTRVNVTGGFRKL